MPVNKKSPAVHLQVCQLRKLLCKFACNIISAIVAVLYAIVVSYILASFALQAAITIILQHASMTAQHLLYINGENLFNFAYVLCIIFAVNVLVILQIGRVYHLAKHGCNTLAKYITLVYSHVYKYLQSCNRLVGCHGKKAGAHGSSEQSE